jgi:hypothetical protein
MAFASHEDVVLMRMVSTILFVSIALTATAHADEASPNAPVTGWTVGVGPVAELVPSSTAGALGTVGVQLDVGKRTPDVYLGVTGELSYIYGSPNLQGAAFSADVPSLRARAGVEIRYALMSWDGYTSCLGNYEPPGSLWVGLRGGAEIRDAQEHKFDVAIAYNMDRWCRSLEIHSIIKRVERDTSVKFVSATQEFTDAPEGEYSKASSRCSTSTTPE